MHENGKWSVKIRVVTIKFKNHFKQLPVPFRIYADLNVMLKDEETVI